MTYDDITLTIQWDRMVSIVDEIFLSLIRTSFSTIVREAYDLCCSVFNRRGRLLAQATQSAPSFLGTLPQTVQHFIQRFPPDTLRPGDILITNDPWMGTGHLYDVSVIRPVFRGDTLVAFTGTVTHLPDIGGIGFSAVAREVFEEGLRIPPMKLAEAGRLNDTLLMLIRENVRVPEQTLGDLHANIAANQTGARLITELMDEYDLDSLDALSDAIQSRSEAAMRQELQTLPDGRYTHQFDIEGFDNSIAVACSVEIRGDEVHIDFAGTDPIVAAGIKSRSVTPMRSAPMPSNASPPLRCPIMTAVSSPCMSRRPRDAFSTRCRLPRPVAATPSATLSPLLFGAPWPRQCPSGWRPRLD
jgi:N-methylhydantoinase B